MDTIQPRSLEKVKLHEEILAAQLKHATHIRERLQEQFNSALENEQRLMKDIKETKQQKELQESVLEQAAERKKGGKITSDVRELIFKNVDKYGMSYHDVEEVFQVPYATTSKIVNEKRKREADSNFIVDDEPPKKMQKLAGKPLGQQINQLSCLSWIDEDPRITVEQLQDKFEGQMVHVSAMSIYRFVNKFSFSWKKDFGIPNEWNADHILLARKRYVQELQDGIGFQRNIVYIGETGGLQLLKNSESETHVRMAISPNAKRLHCFLAISKNNMVHMSTVLESKDLEKSGRCGYFDSLKFFLYDVALKIPAESLVIMNRTNIHDDEELQDAWDYMKNRYQIDRLYLPKHSHFLNPIEYLLDNVKEQIENDLVSDSMNNLEDLQQKVREHLGKMSSETIKSAIVTSTKYYNQAKEGIPFTGLILKPDPAPHLLVKYLPEEDLSAHSQS